MVSWNQWEQETIKESQEMVNMETSDLSESRQIGNRL
jgi:hypothetical protein